MTEKPPSPLPRKRAPSTGPKTPAGKSTSSKNALTHGATSLKLISEGEHSSYEAWVEELTTQYPSTNPLVKLQIQRVAQLKIQLDRIQTAITGLHEIERIKTPKLDRAAEIMELSQEDLSHMAHLGLWAAKGTLDETPEYFAMLPISIELAEIEDLDKLSTHEEFQEEAPQFCRYLIDCAQRAEYDIDTYARSKTIPKPVNPNNVGRSGAKETPQVTFTIRWQGQKNDLKNLITDVPIEDLIATAKWHRLQLAKIISRTQRVAPLERISDIAVHTALPNLDTLDRLMRYQSTVNRQLSTAIGELMAIVRSG